MNLRGKMKKLQTAIVKTGLVIKINSSQFYSDDQKRMITSYRVFTPITYWNEKKQEWKDADYEIISTCSMVELILCMKDIYEVMQLWH